MNGLCVTPADLSVIPANLSVIPAKAGIHAAAEPRSNSCLDSRFRGSDGNSPCAF
jgi:hypothetical protein